MTLRCRILHALTTDPRFKSQSLDNLGDCARVALWLAEDLGDEDALRDAYNQAAAQVREAYTVTDIGFEAKRHAEPTPEAQARQHAEVEYTKAIMTALRDRYGS